MNPQQSASSPADSLHAEARDVLRRLTGVADAEFHDGPPWPEHPQRLMVHDHYVSQVQNEIEKVANLGSESSK